MSIDSLISRLSLNDVSKSITSGKKISDESFKNIIFNETETIFKYSYTVNQLKNACKEKSLKISGTKSELINRLYYFFKLNKSVLIIQKAFRNHMVKLYNDCHGPALFKRDMCVNESDFLTMENLKDISYSQFISFKDADGYIYGFDITSLYNLYVQDRKSVPKNPYNRSDFPSGTRRMMVRFIRLSQLLNIETNLIIENEIPQQLTFGNRVTSVFQKMDELGNYTNEVWFNSLDRSKLLKFVKELEDIWQYRAQLSNTTKREICASNPFTILAYIPISNPNITINDLQDISLSIIEKMVFSGINRDAQYLGTTFVLSALTLVNVEAAEALPWLYQSVAHF